MDAVPREGYFVGKLAKSIKKGVKKIGKGVKKFAKSDLGKAAMLAAGAYFMPGIGIKAQGGLGSFLGNLGTKASSATNFFKPKQASQLVQKSNVLSPSLANKVSLANKAVDSGLPRFEVGSGYFGETRDKGGIKSLLSDLFQDEKKRNILSDVLKGATSIAGGKLAMDDQKRINEARQKSYDDYIARRDSIASELDQTIPELDIRMANGGRVEYSEGTPEIGMIDPNKAKQAKQMLGMGADQDLISTITGLSKEQIEFLKRENKAEGGIMMMADLEDDYERDYRENGGIIELDIRTNPQGTKEIDYRENGGFVPPIGIKEKADDIPAMLSNNEFVFTADAVRGMGNGSIKKGVKKMYALMREAEGKA